MSYKMKWPYQVQFFFYNFLLICSTNAKYIQIYTHFCNYACILHVSVHSHIHISNVFIIHYCDVFHLFQGQRCMHAHQSVYDCLYQSVLFSSVNYLVCLLGTRLRIHWCSFVVHVTWHLHQCVVGMKLNWLSSNRSVYTFLLVLFSGHSPWLSK